MIVLPVAVSPVNEITGTSGWATSAAPASSPTPCTMLNTPGGTPASSMISGNRLAVSGVSSAGLSTTVHPAARHGASFHVASMNGTFHGVIRPATPLRAADRRSRTGWRRGRRPRGSPRTRRRSTGSSRPTGPRARGPGVTGRPVSNDSNAAISSAAALDRVGDALQQSRIAAVPARPAHASKAAAAARDGAVDVGGAASGERRRTSRGSTGSSTASVAPSALSTCSPPM